MQLNLNMILAHWEFAQYQKKFLLSSEPFFVHLMNGEYKFDGGNDKKMVEHNILVWLHLNM